jgi:hypothetical protein
VAPLADASLRTEERRVLERLVELLKDDLGPICAVFGSTVRAREASLRVQSPTLLVVSTRGRFQDELRVINLLFRAAEAEGANPAFFSPKPYDPDLIAKRRKFVPLHAGGRSRQDRPLRRAVSPRSEEFMASARERLAIASMLGA